ncbi:unnamed protein product [Rhizophagus irregularis]|jgi:hypothetical protein|nr:unnamed protein product [Rhizophagus irregularis]
MEHRTESNFSNSSMNDQLGTSTTSFQSYSSNYIRGRRNRRELKRRMQVLDPFRYLQLPVQVTTDSFTDQIFNGTPNFF